MKNSRGFGLLMTVMIMLCMLVIFLQVTTYVTENLFSKTALTKRQLAGYIAMQDFAQLAQNAYQTYQSNGGVCPSGTTRIPAAKPFCWPDHNTTNYPDCITHPLAGPTARLICLNSSSAENMEIISQNNSEPWWKRVFGYFGSTAQAQVVVDEYLPSLAGAPTVNYSGAPNCTSSFDSTYCKMCQTVGTNTQNLNCLYLRICLKNQVCNTADNSEWSIQRIGVQIF